MTHDPVFDTFVLARHDMDVFRVQINGSATLLWPSKEQALRYMRRLEETKLQARPRQVISGSHGA